MQGMTMYAVRMIVTAISICRPESGAVKHLSMSISCFHDCFHDGRSARGVQLQLARDATNSLY